MLHLLQCCQAPASSQLTSFTGCISWQHAKALTGSTLTHCAFVAAADLRAALEARAAEAALYRKQYDMLCRKLEYLEEQQRQASCAARSKVTIITRIDDTFLHKV